MRHEMGHEMQRDVPMSVDLAQIAAWLRARADRGGVATSGSDARNIGVATLGSDARNIGGVIDGVAANYIAEALDELAGDVARLEKRLFAERLARVVAEARLAKVKIPALVEALGRDLAIAKGQREGRVVDLREVFARELRDSDDVSSGGNDTGDAA